MAQRTANAFSVALVLVTPLAVSEVRAELTICNQTNDDKSIAIGYSSDGQWVSEGWWNIIAGDCSTVVPDNLKQRYYYYLADSTGIPHQGEGYHFCTERSVFTIIGDENCENRGYTRSNFSRIDTGETATSYTFTLAATSASSQQTTIVPEPGTYGEPISVNGLHMGCTSDFGEEYCSVAGQEWTYVIGRDERTPDAVYRQLLAIAEGQGVQIEGDVFQYGDTSIVITARTVEQTDYSLEDLYDDPQDDALWAMLEGQWISVDDPLSSIGFFGGTYSEVYNGEELGVGFYEVNSVCSEYSDVLAVVFEGDNDPICYSIAEVTETTLDLIYLPRGNMLRYRKVN